MTIPVLQAPQVSMEEAPGVRVHGVDATNPRADTLGAVSSILTHTATQQVDEAAKQMMLANQVRVDDALNQVRAAQQKLTYDPDSGYLAQKGAAAVQPNDQGLRLDDAYTAKLQSSISEASANLANDAQRRVFNTHAQQMTTAFSGQLQSHVLQESKTFGLQTQQGTVDLAKQNAILNWQDDTQVATEIQSAKAAVWKAGQISGEPANLTQAKMNDVTAQIHADVIKSALDSDNPLYAAAYMAKYKNELGSQLLNVYGQVNRQVQGRAAAEASQLAGRQMKANMNPTDFDRMLNITKQTESGGNAAAVGPYIEGQGSAQGSMQVMPATGTNPGYGVKPAQDNSPQEQARVGADYLAAMVNKYGDPKKAWAAYNAGPAKVDAAIKSFGGNWLSQMPSETQNYVKVNNDAFIKGGGTPKIPSQADFDNKAIEALGPNPDPELVNLTLNETKRHYAELMNQRKTDGENAVQQAQKWLIQNQGNFAAMPTDLKTAITSDAPDKYDDVQTFAKHLAAPTQSDNMEAYHSAISHPDELAHMSDATFQRFAMANFSETTQKQLAKVREDIISGKTNDSSEAINTKAFNDTLNTRLTSLGIDAKPKHDDAQGKERVGTIQRFLTDAVYERQQQVGHKLTPEELTNFIDQNFAKNMEFRSAFLGIPVSGTQQMPLMQMKTSDIPSDQLSQVKQALANRGVVNPTNDQIMRTYWTSKTHGGQ